MENINGCNALAYIVFCLFVSSTFAQSNNAATAAMTKPKFTSPNVASLGKFGDTPMSYHTGVANISIPIFTIKEGSLSVPMTLDYHSGGIRVDDVAGWAGIGWSLNVGGSITRVIHGGPDEGKKSSFNGGSDCGIRGWYKDSGIAPCMILDTKPGHCGSINQADGRGSLASASCYSIYMAASKGTIDSEPDTYSFDMPGHHGRFLFDEKRNPQMIPQGSYHIRPEFYPGEFRTWTILAPDGTKFLFGGPDATENTYTSADVSASNSDDSKSATTWYLTRIESPNGNDWIEFTYEAEKFSFGTKRSQSFVYSRWAQSGSYLKPEGIFITSVDGRRIHRINTSSGLTQALFTPAHEPRRDLTSYTNASSDNTDARALGRIEISYGMFCKQFVLATSYFESDRSVLFSNLDLPHDALRLRLDSIQEVSCDQSISIPPHVFHYETSVQLPRRYSFAQDHWGYPNGQLLNPTLLPPFRFIGSGVLIPGADRSVNENAMRAGILRKITYPTNGTSSYEYEAHRTTPASSQLIGGLRIKSITDDDGLGNTVVRNFRYLQGILYQSGDSYENNLDLNPNIFPASPMGFYSFGTSISASPNPGMQDTQGYHIGYSMVEASIPGNGRSVYHYYNTIPRYDNRSYPRPPSISVIGTATMSMEQHFTDDDRLVKEIRYEYEQEGPVTNIKGKKVVAAFPLVDASIPGIYQQNILPDFGYPLYTDYFIHTQRDRLKRKIEIADGQTLITRFSYDSIKFLHDFPKAEKFTSSSGAVHERLMQYPADVARVPLMYDVTASSFKNMVSVPVELASKVNNRLIERKTNNYVAVQGNIRLASYDYFPGTDVGLTTGFGYDGKGNVNTIAEANHQPLAYLYGYQNSAVIAEVSNARPDQVFHTSFEDEGTPLPTARTGRKSWSGPYNLKASLAPGTYLITWWEKRNNRPDSPWTFKQREITTTGSLSVTVGTVDFWLDEVRVQPPYATMRTCAYLAPGVISTIADPNGRVQRFEYDKLGRLLVIRDDDNNIVKAYTYSYNH